MLDVSYLAPGLFVLLFVVVIALIAGPSYELVRWRMTGRVGARPQGWMASVLVFIVAGIVFLASMCGTNLCCSKTPAPPSAVHPESLLAEDVRGDTTLRSRLFEFIDAQLEFDSLTHGAYDRQFLDELVVDTVTRTTLLSPVPGGLVGTLFPERRAHRNRGTLKAGAPGRISLMVVIGDTVRGFARPYDKLMLPAGTSYVWVKNLSLLDDSGVADAYFIPRRLNVPVVKDTVFVRNNRYNRGALRGRRFFWNNASAWWRYREDDAAAWWACEKGLCCER